MPTYEYSCEKCAGTFEIVPGSIAQTALATLLTFLLNPVANALQRWGFGRAR